MINLSIETNTIRTHWIAQCAILLTLEILFLTVPFLQIELGSFTIVFSALPIAIASVILGFRASIILGTAWGVISFSQAFTDAFGLIMLESSFFGTLFDLGLTRVLVGICTWLTYKVLPKQGYWTNLSVAITCFSASVYNNLFFMCGMMVFFKDAFMSYIYPILWASILFNMLPETIVCVVIGTPAVSALRKSKLAINQ